MTDLYFDASQAGVAGDMLLSSLVSLGADPISIEQRLSPLSDDLPIKLQFSPVSRCGVAALHFSLVEPYPEFRHHSYVDIIKLIQDAQFTSFVSHLAMAIFTVIGEAEAKIHQVPIEEVHFHEVGAIDSIVDVIGVALALEQLKIDHIYSSYLALGYGNLDCSHGRYPVPAPATLEILQSVPVLGGQVPFELTTPTGAAILKVLVQSYTQGLPSMHIEKIGYGAGTRDIPNIPNVLRAIQGRFNGA